MLYHGGPNFAVKCSTCSSSDNVLMDSLPFFTCEKLQLYMKLLYMC